MVHHRVPIRHQGILLLLPLRRTYGSGGVILSSDGHSGQVYVNVGVVFPYILRGCPHKSPTQLCVVPKGPPAVPARARLLMQMDRSVVKVVALPVTDARSSIEVLLALQGADRTRCRAGRRASYKAAVARRVPRPSPAAATL